VEAGTGVGLALGDAVLIEQRITDQIAALARPRRDPGGRLVAPPPYVRRHLVEHAAAGGKWHPSLTAPEFLPFVDAGRYRAALGRFRVQGTGASVGVRAWLGAAHAWDWDAPTANASALAIWSRALGLQPAAREANQWRAAWASWPLGIGEMIGRHQSPAAAVTVLLRADGTPIAVTGSHDATVRVWDLNTGHPIGDPLTGHTNAVNAVAVLLRPDGTPIAVTGSWDQTVRVWDLNTGQPIGDRHTGHTHAVTSVAVLVPPDRTPIAVTGSLDWTVRVWDLNTGQPIGDRHTGHPLTGHKQAVTSVAVLLRADGTPIAVTGSEDHTVRVWDLDTGQPIGEPLTGHAHAVTSVAVLVRADGTPIAVTGSYDQTVRVWDLVGLVPAGYPLLHVPSGVSSLAVVSSSDPPGLLVAGQGVLMVNFPSEVSA
jgi:WD40 repeat protein